MRRILGVVIPSAMGIVIFFLAQGVSFAGPSPQAKYVGAKKCMMCHFKQYKTWQKTDMSKAYKLIANESDKEKCYKCHTTGYDRPGGFKDSASTPGLEGVQCESCHGPGSEHMAVPMSDKAKKRATIEVVPKDCSSCHNPHVSDKAAAARAGK
ncbi:MAG: hypothetical protein GXO98_01345 [Nitrospirae bacterium]|nr:hypothetical protein [Nitrospirota bacterium]